MNFPEQSAQFERIDEWFRQADGLLITAGAGMGVDSGLPDFRGPTGFWRAYPALKNHGFTFKHMANPIGFKNAPYMAWGFYGHRLGLYRNTIPHSGFRILLEWAAKMEQGAFVFTSNVDGQFQTAGFSEDRIVECHGSIHLMQCSRPCREHLWRADDFHPSVDMNVCELTNDVPRCPACGEIARPNILMFNDWGWISARTNRQQNNLEAWLRQVKKPLIIEIGAGRSIPTVRNFSERQGARVIRINPREPDILSDIGIGLAGGAEEVLRALDKSIIRRGDPRGSASPDQSL